MRIVIEAEPKEIAALAVALQERQREKFVPEHGAEKANVENPEIT